MSDDVYTAALAATPRNAERTCLHCSKQAVEGGRFCEVHLAALEERQRLDRRRELLSEVRDWKTRCLGTLPAWEWARFDNAAYVKNVSPKLRQAVEKWHPTMGNLALCAPTGQGKTSLLVAKAHDMLARATALVARGEAPGLWWFRFTSALELVAARRRHKLGTEEPEVIRAAMERHHGVLILDEVGFEDMRDQLILEIADARNKAGACTVITTGLSPKAFADRYGAAVWRRFTEGGHEVVGEFPKGKG